MLLTFSLILLSCNNNLINSERNQAQIYASVIKQLYLTDFSPGSTTGYIMKYTDDNAGTEYPTLNSTPLPESLQRAVLSALGDIRQYFIWVDNGSDISDRVISGGSFEIILGNIHFQEDNSVQVTASLFFGGTGGGGTTYILKKINGDWKVTGRTGRSWIG
jgi:hypothetical protein